MANDARGRADSEERLRELGGLAADDSLRALNVASGIRAIAHLLGSGAALGSVGNGELAALVTIVADDAERVAERQLLDEARRA